MRLALTRGEGLEGACRMSHVSMLRYVPLVCVCKDMHMCALHSSIGWIRQLMNPSAPFAIVCAHKAGWLAGWRKTSITTQGRQT